MRAPISVIIPTLNTEAPLKSCLEGLVEGLDAGLIRELIVSDGGSSDATGAIAQAWGAEVLHGEPSRGGQLRRGCEAAQGEWLLVLHADTRLAPGWSKAVQRHLTTTKAGWFKLAVEGASVAGRFFAAWANLRSRVGLPYGYQGLLVPRAVYEDAGGYPDQPVMEDVTLACALRGQMAAIPVLATTSAKTYLTKGWVRRGAHELWTLARFLLGASPDKIAARYAAPLSSTKRNP